mmetsp:Transcript_38692/g.114975  ORF Transcript_38692/g.114975 Transcript_38692/m.114975 type:complete len:264 (-) Transcript_38692:2411-3202(-)
MYATFRAASDALASSQAISVASPLVFTNTMVALVTGASSVDTWFGVTRRSAPNVASLISSGRSMAWYRQTDELPSVSMTSPTLSSSTSLGTDTLAMRSKLDLDSSTMPPLPASAIALVMSMGGPTKHVRPVVSSLSTCWSPTPVCMPMRTRMPRNASCGLASSHASSLPCLLARPPLAACTPHSDASSDCIVVRGCASRANASADARRAPRVSVARCARSRSLGSNVALARKKTAESLACQLAWPARPRLSLGAGLVGEDSPR